MAKSRRNVSRRKRQQKRRNSRRNFRKLLRGGGLVDNFTDAELEKLFEHSSTEEIIKNTIERLREKNSWDEFIKNYDWGKLISHYNVKRIITEKEKEKEAERLKKNTAELERKKQIEEDKIKEEIKNGTKTELTDEEYKYLQPSPPVYENHTIGFLDKRRWTKSNGKWVHATELASGPNPADMGW